MKLGRRLPKSNYSDFVKKFLGYRLGYCLPVLRDFLLPSYRFGIDPIQLACMIEIIETTRGSGGLVCEIGVGAGYTATFLLEHMRSASNPAKVVLVDTFSGFTKYSMTHEVEQRSKHQVDIDRFKYGSPVVLERNLRRLGYSGFQVIAQDCQMVDWDQLGPIAAALIDVDLYLPSRHVLEKVWPLVVPGGGCLVDDCIAGGPWDGAVQAYSEFVEAHDLPFIKVGRKGGLLKKPARVEST